MRRLVALVLAGLVLAPAAVWADGVTSRTRCSIPHFVRRNGTEIRTAIVVFNNGDPANPATIERLTIYDFFGIVVHDSGPAAGTPHPLNTDFTTPVDITTVPPGATYFLATNHIWGVNPIPGSGGNERGQAMSVVVEVSKKGNPNLFSVRGRARTRERVQNPNGGFTHGGELASNLLHCFTLNP